MIEDRITNSIPYLAFPSLEKLDFINHIFTTREGGVSGGYYSSMNLGFTNGDDPENVKKNYDIIADLLQVNVDHIVMSKQTHTANVKRVTSEDVFHDGMLHKSPFNDVDGMITNEPGIALATFYADCVPLYFVDPINKAIGLSHSGWRGTVAGMGAETVKCMQDNFGSRPEDMICAIGPSICQSCYEISEDVADEFVKAFPGKQNSILKTGKEKGKYQLDLWEANRIILTGAGVKNENIELAGLCTCCNNQKLFSHRATGGKRGNLAAFLMIK